MLPVYLPTPSLDAGDRLHLLFSKMFPQLFPLVSTVFPSSPHFSNAFPPFSAIAPHFPPFPPIFPFVPFFLGNVAGYLIAGRVRDWWALPLETASPNKHLKCGLCGKNAEPSIPSLATPS